MDTLLLVVLDIPAPLGMREILLGSVAALCALFLGITFGQSAFDKISDYKGNREYFNVQFGKSPLKKLVVILLPVIMLMESASAILCLSGIVFAAFFNNLIPLILGLLLSSGTLICLLFGQRLAKDYAGAVSITGYFLIAVAGLLALAIAF
jgi:putative oxidoreductase